MMNAGMVRRLTGFPVVRVEPDLGVWWDTDDAHIGRSSISFSDRWPDPQDMNTPEPESEK